MERIINMGKQMFDNVVVRLKEVDVKLPSQDSARIMG